LAVFQDTEAPLDTPLTYTTGSPDASGTQVVSTPMVTVSGNGLCWLKDPLRPAASLRLELASARNACMTPRGIYLTGLGEETRSADTGIFDLVDTARPVVAANRRKDPSGTLTLVTRTIVDLDQVTTLLAPGTPLLLQVPAVYGMPDAYLSVGDVRISRIARDHRRPWRRLTCPYVVVDRPSGSAQGLPGSRWADLSASYPTWADLTATGATWLDLLRGWNT
jgi:hypothetical protein